MKRIISINLKGLIFQIEDDAFEKLDQYLRQLRAHFNKAEGSAEIMDDIESRLAEMLVRDPGTQSPVTLNRVNEIIALMGNPSEISEEEEDSTEKESGAATKSRKLYRDGEGKVLGGVCSGLGIYFDIDPLWIRIGFLFAFLTFGTGLLLYVILWLLIPEAKSASERLEMQGKPINIDSIEKTVREEFERVKKNFDEGRWPEKTRDMASDLKTGLRNGLLPLLGFVARLFGFFLVITATAMLILFGLAYLGMLTDYVRLPLYPFFSHLFPDPFAGTLFNVFLILLILIPIAGLLLGGVRMLLGRYTEFRWLGRLLGSVWFLSLLGSVGMGFMLADSWRERATLSEEVILKPTDTLYIHSANMVSHHDKSFNLEFGRSRGVRGLYILDQDSLKRPVQLNILVSADGQARLKTSRISNGKDHDDATRLASHITEQIETEGKNLRFNPYYAIGIDDPWKNQVLIYDLYLPPGMIVVFGSNLASFLDHVETDNYIHQSQLEGKAFAMTKKGLLIPPSSTEGNTDESAYPYSGFDEIVLNGVPDVMIYESESFRINTSSDCNYHPMIEQYGKRLIVRIPVGMMGNAAGLLKIGMPTLKELEANGGTTVSLQFTTQEECSIELNGSVHLQGQLNCRKVNLEANGFNEVNLDGQVTLLNLEVNGAGSFDLSDFKADEVDVESDGTAELQLTVIKKLKAEAGGSSFIRYRGKPTGKTIKTRGSARIEEE